MAKFPLKRRGARRPKKSTRSTKTSTKTSPVFARKVKKVIHQMTENKFWSQQLANNLIPAPYTASTSGGSISPFQLSLLPTLTQGTGISGRVGNRVRLVKNRIRGIINMKPYNATTAPYIAPVYVKMWVISPKSFTNYVGDLGYTNWQQFFSINNSDTGFTGGVLDLMIPVNKELFTLHTTRTYQLSNNGTGSGIYQSPSGYFSRTFSIDLIKYVKDLKYDDNSSTRPTNKNLILVAACYIGDGTSNNPSGGSALEMAELHYVHDCEYEDL